MVFIYEVSRFMLMCTVSSGSVLCILHFLDPCPVVFHTPCGWSFLLGICLSLGLSNSVAGICFPEPVANHLEIFHPYVKMLLV